MIEKANLQGVMDVLQRAQTASHVVEAQSNKIEGGVPQTEFAADLLKAIRSVNETQMGAAELKTQYEAGEDVTLTDILVDSQRASVAFEATLQVRNKILKAYQDVMSMPV